MGFYGELVFGRSQGSLLQAPVFGSAEARRERDIAQWRRAEGWQTVQVAANVLREEPAQVLQEVVAWTGAPACVVSVADSDYALLQGLAVSGEKWDTWLNLDIAAAMLAEVPADVEDTSVWYASPQAEQAEDRKLKVLDAQVPTDARRALAWAQAAGYGADVSVARVERALRARSTFVEDLLDPILDELGFPTAAPRC